MPHVNTSFAQDIRLVMCGARVSLKHRNYQALNSVGNRKMRMPSEKWSGRLPMQCVVLSRSVEELKATEDDGNV